MIAYAVRRAGLFLGAFALIACGERSAAWDGGDDGSQPASDAGADSGHFCGSIDAATLCDDFDDPAIAFGAQWNSGKNVGNAGSLGLTGDALTAPHALLAAVSTATPADESAALEHTLTKAAAATLDLDFYVDAMADGKYAFVALLSQGAGEGYVALSVGASLGTASVELAIYELGDAQAARRFGTTPIAIGAWHHATVAVVYGASGSASLRVDDGAAAQTSIGLDTSQLVLDVGLAPASPGVTISVDDVVLRAQ